MSLEDVMKALMQTPSGSQQQPASGDAMSQMLGGLMGGGQQGGGGEALAQAIGGLLGSASTGGAQTSGAPAVGQLLGGLEQIIGGQPGSGQISMNQGAAMNMGSMAMNDPIMMLLQPVVTQLAAKANISPQIAMVVASIALHYLIQSHPSTPGNSPLNLGNVMQQLASGGRLEQATLQNSGMVNDVVQATGLNEQQAVKTLNQTFNLLGGQVKGAGVKGKAKIKRKK